MIDMPTGQSDSVLGGHFIIAHEVVAARTEILGAISTVQTRIHRVIFTGHSLGGARAKTAYFLLRDAISSTTRNIHFITFGSPLMCRKTIDDVAAGNIHNIFNGFDIVPRVLGSHALPDYIKSILGWIHPTAESVYDSVIINRSHFRPFGNYYALVSNELMFCSKPNKLLEIFPETINMFRTDALGLILGVSTAWNRAIITVVALQSLLVEEER